jgi:phosphoglycerate kinase
MKYGINTLDDLEVAGKVVLCRVDINSPIHQATGGLRDVTRIKGCAPTVRELAEGGARVVLLAHQGGDLEYKNYASTEPHAAVLAELIGRPVTFLDDVCGPAARQAIAELVDGEVLLLDNVRFMAEEMTLFETKLKLAPAEQAKTLVVRKLAPLGDLFVCDAFAAVHRSQPTLVGFQQLLPSAMGRLFEQEYAALSKLMEEPDRPCVFFLGGAKVQDAFLMMRSVLAGGVADRVLTSGLVANIMFLAKGIDIGAASADFIAQQQLGEYVAIAHTLLAEYGARIELPVDLAYVADGVRREAPIAALPQEHLLADIGAQTIAAYGDLIARAATVFVNGPAGVFEDRATEAGTKATWEAMAHSQAFSVLGGGDSIAAMNKYGLAGEFSYVCTGGGALVRFLSGEELPVVTALKHAAATFAAAGAR